MASFVYALHDFVPENPDEIEFKAGERIEVLERDDVYQDGWWQGKNLAGAMGLFPVSYTQPAPTAAPAPAPAAAVPAPPPAEPAPEETPVSAPAPLPETREEEEEEEEDAPPPTATAGNMLLPLPEESEPAVSTGGKVTPNGEVMRATMTDVQQALEQLGRHADEADGARSFTFASTRDGESTDNDSDDGRAGARDTMDEEPGEDWYRSTRARLAERARQQVAAARAEEAARAQPQPQLPPIDVDISDESDAEDDTRHPPRAHPHIPEESEGEEDEVVAPGPRGEPSPFVEPSEHFIVPSPAVDVAPLPTARQENFALPPPVGPSPAEVAASAVPPPAADEPPSPAGALPSPAPTRFQDSPEGSARLGTDPSTPPTSHAPESTALSPTSAVAPGSSHGATRKSSLAPRGHPTDWSVEEVVDWLRSRGFDDSVCDKFTEQEITGDVLLDLDVNMLKAELGIVAFGKRMRIANAIADLRRPPSVISEAPGAAPTTASSQSGHFPQSATFTSAGGVFSAPSTSVSQSHSGPASVSGAGPASPFTQTHSKTVSSATAVTHLSSPYTPASLQAPFAEHQERSLRAPSDAGSESQATVGLGLASAGVPGALLPGGGRPPAGKGRPSQLTLSPSDSQLGVSAQAVGGEVPDSADAERAAMSEGEAGGKGKRQRRSKDSKAPASAHSRGPSADAGASVGAGEASPKPHARKRSVDAAKPAGDRHSLFGGAFSGTLGKSRKPAPRYSANELDSPEKSGLSFPRLMSGAGRKSSGRPGTADSVAAPGAGALIAKEAKDAKDTNGKRDARRDSVNSGGSKEKRDPSLLRKRASSAAAPGTPTRSPVDGKGGAATNGAVGKAGGGAATLRAGQSILQQIGAPDYNGWMRKKGEHYNVWKSRYFVLKGPHLYWMRSNSPSEVRIKGYVNTTGYRIVADEKIDPGRYGFKLVHESEKPHMFSSEEQNVIREWMKALMKSSIDRDYSKPVVSSVNIPTIPLQVAQAMNPAPRPPSPSQRAATQKALRRENTNQLSTRDAQILMGGVPHAGDAERARLDTVFAAEAPAPMPAANVPAPARPSRELRRGPSVSTTKSTDTTLDPALVEWANSHLPAALYIPADGALPANIGLSLLRLAESIKGAPAAPPVPDAAFGGPDSLEGLFRLFDFLLDHDVRMGSVSINDVRQARRDKIAQLLRALRTWEERRRAVARSIGGGGVGVGGFVAPAGWDA